jgi:hypothetical protein
MPNHFADGQSFSGIAPGIAGLEPIEAKICVVGALLLGKQHGEPFVVGKLGPAATAIKSGGVLCASVQDDHQRCARSEYSG